MPALPAVNNLNTILTALLGAGDTTATVASTAAWPSSGIFSVDQEIVAYSGKTPTTFTGLTRGYDGTVATTHSNGEMVSLRIVAKHLNDAAYQSTVPSTVAVGGIPAGTTFPDKTSVQEILDQMLHPYQEPVVSSFVVDPSDSPGQLHEVGESISGPLSITWTITNSANAVPGSGQIDDLTTPTLLAITQATNPSNSNSIGIPSPISYSVPATHDFQIRITDTNAAYHTRNYALSWRYGRRSGNNANPTLTSSDILALGDLDYANNYAATYFMPATGYKFICQADAAGGQINTVKDAATLFNVPMADATDDAAYSNVDGGGFSYALVSFTNPHGVVLNYRVYRTKYALGGSINLIVS